MVREVRMVTLKTSKFYTSYQVVFVIGLFIIVLSFLWQVFAGGYYQTDPLQSFVLVLGACFFTWTILFSVALSWFNDMSVVTVDGERLIGKPLFGSKVELLVSEIVEVENIRAGFIGFAFNTKEGIRFAPSMNIDFRGFIYDYILERLPAGATYDAEKVRELRKKPNYWHYSRSLYKAAEYSSSELTAIQEAAQAQFDEFKTRGLLSPEARFGER